METIPKLSPEAAVFTALNAGDVPSLVQLEQACFSQPWGEAECTASFTQQAFMAYGLKQGLVLVGYVALYHTFDELEILNIAIAPAWRQQGMGTRLLSLTLQEACKKGISRAVLEVRTGNAPAMALYKAQGFVPVGRRRQYYADTGEDALIYVCDLAAARDKKDKV
jgi:[ribosomal protein S18]-alanine N-acetyltransferase